MVRVEWEDSSTHNGWDSRSHDSYSLATCTTVGFLIHKDNKKVSIALSVCPDGDANGVMTLPRKCVTRIVELREEV
jgi:hypothetical protein